MENEVKEPAAKYNYVSPEDYLAMERASQEKHEYFKGEVFAMSGASPNHNNIAYNLNRIVAPFVYTKGCKLFGSDFRVHIPDNTLYTYPDFSIVCGDYRSSVMYSDNLTTPSVIIEILSKSTRDYDRGTKFGLYREIKSLKEYILIDSTKVFVELFKKQEDNKWLLSEFKQLTDSFVISTIGLTLLLKDVYEDVSIEV
jgi:Uma2 family endonuclease